MKISFLLFAALLGLVIWLSIVVKEVVSVSFLAVIASFSALALGTVLLRRTGQFTLKPMLTLVAGTGAALALAFSSLPLRLVFGHHEAQFDALAATLKAGEVIQYPHQIGPFRLIDGGIREGTGDPYFVTGGDPYEIDGFVANSDGAYFNAWSVIPLGKSWSFVSED